MKEEIILTDKNNITSDGRKFPKTPRPEVIYGGIFPECKILKRILYKIKEKRIERARKKIEKSRRQLKEMYRLLWDEIIIIK